jgi:hypothetical protein
MRQVSYEIYSVVLEPPDLSLLYILSTLYWILTESTSTKSLAVSSLSLQKQID